MTFKSIFLSRVRALTASSSSVVILALAFLRAVSAFSSALSLTDPDAITGLPKHFICQHRRDAPEVPPDHSQNHLINYLQIVGRLSLAVIVVADPAITTIDFTLIYLLRTIGEGSGLAVVMIGEETSTVDAIDDFRQQFLACALQVCRSVIGKHRRALLHQFVAILEKVVIDEPKVLKRL